MEEYFLNFIRSLQSEQKLSLEIKKMIGATWKPGQLFCNLHFTIAIPEGIKVVMNEYQSCTVEQGYFDQWAISIIYKFYNCNCSNN